MRLCPGIATTSCLYKSSKTHSDSTSIVFSTHVLDAFCLACRASSHLSYRPTHSPATMKQRFSSLDVRVIASELAVSLITLRIQNIYNLSTRIFLFKFAKPGKREQLLVDSGFRAHLTSFTRTASTFPSAFVQKLRRYLKSRRVTGVRQVGTDRVIELTFSEGQYRLYLEFFAAGNIVLTDADLNVLALLRQVSEGNEDVDVKVGGRYVLEKKQNYNGIPPVTEERVRESLQKATNRMKEAQEVGGKKAKRAKGGDDLRRALSAGFQEFPPHLLEHVFQEAEVNVEWKIDEVLDQADKMEKVMLALHKATAVYDSLESDNAKGYIISKIKDGHDESDSTGPSRDALLYDDFHPFRPSQFDKRRATHILELDGFNKTVDEFYSSIESQKLESRLEEREQQAEKRLQSAKDEHAKRLGALQHVQELHIRNAEAIEANTHRVEEAIAAVNGLIGQGMDWVDIGKLIENEQKRGNAVAQMVKLPLKLEENTVTVLLEEPSFEPEDEDEGYGSDRTEDEYDSEQEDVVSRKENEPAEKRLAIDIDLALGPWQNARLYYDQKKQAATKEQKTMQAAARALKSTEKRIQEDLKKGLKQEKAVLRPARKQFWFEKFLWFVSSDGYLVIGGKDAQQNELLYRRYLKKGDVYVHADLQGASSVIVKNSPQTPDAPMPPSTLSQAGALTVCTSVAWDSKAVMAAWWVNAEQVSKTAETGEYLQTGGFVVRGKKNFLPPSQLLLGFGVVWLITEESRANHGKHRVTKTDEFTDGDVDALTEGADSLSIEGGDDQLEDGGGGAVPDVEDAANEAQNEIEEDDEAVNDDARDGENDDEDPNEDDYNDNDEAVRDDDHRANPLQASGLQDSTPGTYNDVVPNAQADHSSEVSESNAEDESAAEAETPDPSTTMASTRPDTPLSSAPSTQPSKQKQQAKRGKRGKQKRAAKKYAEQSDDDRALAMSLLGSNKTTERKQAAEEDKVAAEAKREADRERRRKQHQKAAERERVRHERIAGGEAPMPTTGAGVAYGPDDDEIDAEQALQELQEHKNIDLLVPVPEPGDELVAAIPVVAPWTALSRNKYKVKLQPGNLKKGKAVKEIVGMWSGLDKVGGGKGRRIVDEGNSDREKVWAKEVELIKEWRVEEVVGSVPVKGCRIVQGGGILGSAGGAVGGGKGGKGSGGQKGKTGGKGGKKGR